MDIKKNRLVMLNKAPVEEVKREKKPAKSFKQCMEEREEKEEGKDIGEREFPSPFEMMEGKEELVTPFILPALQGEGEIFCATAQSTPAIGMISEEASYLTQVAAEEMVAIVESDRGVCTVTVTYAFEDSPFNGTKIIIDHWDTHPSAFRVQLVGHPEVMEQLNHEFAALSQAFESHPLLQAFEVELLPPIYFEKGKGSKSTFEKRKERGKAVAFASGKSAF